MFNVGSTFGAWTPAAVFPKSDRVSVNEMNSLLFQTDQILGSLHIFAPRFFLRICILLLLRVFPFFFRGLPAVRALASFNCNLRGIAANQSIDRSFDLCSVRRSKGSFEIIIPASFLRFEVLSFASTSNNLRFCRLTYFVSCCLRHSHFNQLTECREYYHNSWYSNRERSRVQFFKARDGGISVLSNRQNGWIESGKSGESGESLSGQVEYMPKCRL